MKVNFLYEYTEVNEKLFRKCKKLEDNMQVYTLEEGGDCRRNIEKVSK